MKNRYKKDNLCDMKKGTAIAKMLYPYQEILCILKRIY